MILDPVGMTVEEWTDSINLDLGIFGLIPKLLSPDDWQEWGSQVIGLSGISKYNPPNPYDYSHWMKWADAFNRSMEISGVS